MPLDPLYPLPMASQTALLSRRVHDPTRECPQVYDETHNHMRNEVRRFNTTATKCRKRVHSLSSLDQPATIPLYVTRLRCGRIDGVRQHLWFHLGKDEGEGSAIVWHYTSMMRMVLLPCSISVVMLDITQ